MTSIQFIKDCKNNKLKGVNYCLSHGVDVNTKNVSGVTGLMFACSTGNPAIVSRLVQVPGLDINYQTEEGVTAAWLACRKCHTECVRILAQTDRVDWNKADEWGRTPLCWALIKRLPDVVDLIVLQPNIDYNIKTVFDLTLAQIGNSCLGRTRQVCGDSRRSGQV